jgi:hypothetical protein
MSTNNNNANNTNNTAASTKEQKPSLFFNQIDHISNRVTAMTLMGLIGGASLATFRALPIPRTSLTVAFSCALAGTACLIPERILHHSSFLWFERECEHGHGHGQTLANDTDSNDTDKSDDGFFWNNDVETKRLIASHIGGGIIGGTVTASLYQKRLSLAGMALFTPIMVGIAFMELNLQEYKRIRLRELGATANANANATANANASDASSLRQTR